MVVQSAISIHFYCHPAVLVTCFNFCSFCSLKKMTSFWLLGHIFIKFYFVNSGKSFIVNLLLIILLTMNYFFYHFCPHRRPIKVTQELSIRIHLNSKIAFGILREFTWFVSGHTDQTNLLDVRWKMVNEGWKKKRTVTVAHFIPRFSFSQMVGGGSW